MFTFGMQGKTFSNYIIRIVIERFIQFMDFLYLCVICIRVS